MKKPLHTVVTLVAVCLARHAAAAPAPAETEILGPFTGHYAKLHPDNVKPYRIAYYGTDLGWTYEHAGKLQLLFGDTAATESGDPIQPSTNRRYDDSFGSIDLAEWTDPSRITSGNIPLIKLGQNPGTTEMAAIDPTSKRVSRSRAPTDDRAATQIPCSTWRNIPSRTAAFAVIGRAVSGRARTWVEPMRLASNSASAFAARRTRGATPTSVNG